MRDKQKETRGLADLVAVIIGPVLIMLLVGSLVFFLIEVLYGGDYAGRLRWTFGFYVFGAVLVARLSIEEGDGKAAMYGGGLGVAAFIAMLQFVEYEPGSWQSQFGWLINIGLLVLVWWCARKLTWDCTHVDDKRNASDVSLLEATGLDALERPEELREPETQGDEPQEAQGFWERWQAWRKKEREKPHTPGKWVVYFSLAALPIFGLGQALIPPEETESRQFTFWLMAAYIGSGLGLMMTTSFLGLRRYLQQRKLKLPMSMASLWLGIGAAIIAAFLVVSAILPRPSSETPLVNLDRFGSKDRDADDYSAQGDSAGKGDGAAGDQSDENSKSANSTEGKSKDSGKGKGQDSSGKGSGDDKGKGGDSGKSDQSGNQSSGGKKEGDNRDPNKKDDSKNESGANTDPNSKNKKSASGNNGKKSDGNKSRQSKRRSGGSKSPQTPSSLGKIGSIIKWIVFGIMALAVGYFLFRYGLKFLANFATWAKQLLQMLNNFWAWLFGGRKEEPEHETAAEIEVVQKRPEPFASFANPFETGLGERQTPAELVQYSFAALEAFAYEHDLGRSIHETPIEFSARLSKRSAELAEDAPKLAALYARLAYARGKLPAACREQVKQFWHQLELAHEELLMTCKSEPAESM
jgi:hypothetical protein